MKLLANTVQFIDSFLNNCICFIRSKANGDNVVVGSIKTDRPEVVAIVLVIVFTEIFASLLMLWFLVVLMKIVGWWVGPLLDVFGDVACLISSSQCIIFIAILFLLSESFYFFLFTFYFWKSKHMYTLDTAAFAQSSDFSRPRGQLSASTVTKTEKDQRLLPCCM